MKKIKLKIILKLGILLLGVPLILVSCNKDDALHENLEANQNSDLNFKITSLNNLPKLKPIVKNIKTIKPKVDFDTNSPFSRIENIADLKHIDTDKIVQVTNNTGKSTYSFNIKKPSLSASINFENLYLAEKDDGYMSYILLYEPDYNWYQSHNKLEHGKYVLDFSDYQGHITKYTLDREIIWTTKSDAINTTAARTIEVCFISTWLGCKCNTAGHEDDLSNCTCVGTNSSQTCASGYVSGGYGSSNDDSDGTDSDNTNGGSGGGNATDVPCIPGANGVDTQPLSGSAIDLDGGVTQGTTTECIEQIHPVVIVEEENRNRQCRKISKLFEDYPNYKNKLIELDGKTELPNEVAAGIYDDGSTFDIDGTCDGNEAKIELGTPPQKYRTLAHTHYENQNCNPNTTYSVFSMGDLQYLYTTYKQNKLKPSNFVAFLITGKGTKYALTINNTTNFSAFFNYLDATDFNGTYTTQQERIDAANNLNQNVLTLRKEYYTRELNAKIKNTDTDNINVLEQFLQFIEDGNIGLTVFESDDNFETFTHLKKKPNKIERTNCE